MTTILVGVDASERSADAVAFAHRLAETSRADVLVAATYPYDDRPSRMANRAFRDELEHDAKATVERLAKPLRDLGAERVRTTVLARLSPPHGLQELAEAEQAAMIVVGSSHVGAVGRVLPGSTAERLLHGAPCPVAVAPRDYRTTAHAFRRIGVAFDGSDESGAALDASVALARAGRAELRVIGVAEVLAYGSPAFMVGRAFVAARDDYERSASLELVDVVDGLPGDVAAEAVFRVGDPAGEIAAQTGDLDLLVTGSRGYGPLAAVLLGGVTGRLLRQAACPVLIVPRGVATPLAPLFGPREVPA